MKYKVGDKVRIKSLDWYNANKDKDGIVQVYGSFVPEMREYCGMDAKIVSVNNKFYFIDIDNERWNWSDKMFEDMKETKIKLPEGWEVDKIENGEIILKETKKKLPKTWEECLEMYGECEYIRGCSIVDKQTKPESISSNKNSIPLGLGRPMLALCQLLVCREVYRQGWKPDWKNNKEKYVIDCTSKVDTYMTNYIPKVLSFQSKEVRDEFAENFKDLIEEAKELL